MLVLSRKRGELIRIGDDIFVSVVDIRGDKVRLGVHADKSIPVHREEIYQRIQDGNDAAGERHTCGDSQSDQCEVSTEESGPAAVHAENGLGDRLRALKQDPLEQATPGDR